MAYQFAILLLCFVIVNNSVSQPPTDEVITSAFDFAYTCYFYDGVLDDDSPKSLSKSGFLDFVGKEKNFELVNKFLSENSVSPEAQENIVLNEFWDIVVLICREQDIDIEPFLEERKAAAQLITNAFDIANGSDKLGPVRNTLIIRQSDFLDFVGKEDNVEFVNSYWTANSVSPDAQDKIGFKEFRELVYWICSQREFVIKDFLEERIPVAEAIIDSFDFAIDYYKDYCAENIIFSRSNQYPEFERRYIRQSDILDFLGEDEENVYLQCLNDYRTANLVSVQRRDKIGFEEFRGIMNLICSTKQQFDLKKFLRKRIAVIVVIKEAFDLAFRVFTKTGEKIIQLSDFLYFVGGYEHTFLEAANSVLLEGKEELYMKDFKNTLYLFFSNQEILVKDFLEKRISLVQISAKAFTFARSHFNVGNREHLHQSEFLDFLGRVNSSHLHYVNVYWSSHLVELIKEQDKISFQRFVDLVVFICEKQSIVLKYFLNNRMEAAKGIKTAYLKVQKHFKIDEENPFSQSQFLRFVGRKDNFDLVNQFWTDKSMRPQDIIDSVTFPLLVYYICSKRGYDPNEFINKRKHELNIV